MGAGEQARCSIRRPQQEHAQSDEDGRKEQVLERTETAVARAESDSVNEYQGGDGDQPYAEVLGGLDLAGPPDDLALPSFWDEDPSQNVENYSASAEQRETREGESHQQRIDAEIVGDTTGHTTDDPVLPVGATGQARWPDVRTLWWVRFGPVASGGRRLGA